MGARRNFSRGAKLSTLKKSTFFCAPKAQTKSVFTLGEKRIYTPFIRQTYCELSGRKSTLQKTLGVSWRDAFIRQVFFTVTCSRFVIERMMLLNSSHKSCRVHFRLYSRREERRFLQMPVYCSYFSTQSLDNA